jgi:hypothetical protein
MPNTTENRPLFKVLVNGRSCHGGDFEWSLPTADKPGDWHEVTGELSLCSNGFHLTYAPAAWWVHGQSCEVYEAEHDGELIGPDNDGTEKVCVRRVRLLRRVSDAELPRYNVFLSGDGHVASSGVAVASGSASVRAYGSASVTAYGSASVRAYDSASVTAYDSASVTAYDSCLVHTPSNYLWGAPTVEITGYAVWVDRKSGKPVVHAVTTAGATLVTHERK